MTEAQGIANLIKKPAYGLVRACPPLRRLARRLSRALGSLRYKRLASSVTTDERAVLFISFRGRSYSDSPRAVFEAMLGDERFCDFTFYWEFRDDCIEKYRFLERDPRVRLVRRLSPENLEAFACAKYWVTNGLTPEYVVPKPDQVYIQCWHGTPLKRLGHDIASNAVMALNTTDEYSERYDLEAAKWSNLVTPSAYTTSCLASAFGMDSSWVESKVLELGYPRNDEIVNVCSDSAALDALRLQLSNELGFDPSKKLLLYAPTWRDSEYQAGVGYVQRTLLDFQLMQRELGSDWVVLFRPHCHIANSFDFSEYDMFVVNAAELPDINSLYCIADALVTDYSSVFFDYACTGRPMLFYMPDLEQYQNETRGFYIEPAVDLPGPICMTTAELADAVNDLDQYQNAYCERYRAFRERFCPHEDGHAAQRLVDAVFASGAAQEEARV